MQWTKEWRMPSATANQKSANTDAFARINAAARIEGISYSQLIHQLDQHNVQLSRKALADLATNNPEAFKAVVAKVKA